MGGSLQRLLAGVLLFAVLVALVLVVRERLGGSAQGEHARGDGPSADGDSSGRTLTAPSGISESGARFDRRFAHWEGEFTKYVTEPDFMWRPGATAEEIAQLEAWAGVSLPPDLRRLLQKSNGQEREATSIHFVNRLLSCAEIIEESDSLQEINDDVGLAEEDVKGTSLVEAAGWWHKDLMLFLADDNGGGVAIDRKTGAVWDWDHDGGMFGKLAPDISTFFEWMALAFEEGRTHVFGEGDPPAFYELDPEKVAAKAMGGTAEE